jgi:hypothetical protein
MRNIDVELDSVVFDNCEADELASEPVRVLNFVRVAVQREFVVEHVLNLVL